MLGIPLTTRDILAMSTPTFSVRHTQIS